MFVAKKKIGLVYASEKYNVTLLRSGVHFGVLFLSTNILLLRSKVIRVCPSFGEREHL